MEQMRITQSDVRFRKTLLNFERDDIDVLILCLPTIETNIESIVNSFYEAQIAVPEIAAVIGDADTLKHLQQAQRSYVIDLFSGNYDLDYVNSRLRIGLVHKRIGVEPHLYLSAVYQLQDQLIRALQDELPTDAALRASTALRKLVYFDVSLVFETYIRSLVSEIEAAHTRTDGYARALEQSINERDLMLRLDPLTGVHSRRSLFDALTTTLRSSQRRREPVAVMFIDVDKFKTLNDEKGHAHGDSVLRTIGAILRSVARTNDSAFRYGGDEFCLILSDTTARSAIETVGERIHASLSKQLPGVSVSIGAASTGPYDFDDAETILEQADNAMYRNKHPEIDRSFDDDGGVQRDLD